MTGRDRLIIAIVACVVVVVGGWMLVIQPKRNEASKLAGQITTAQQQLDSARSQAVTATADERAFAHNYASVVRLGEAVPTDDNTASLIVQLQHAASQTSVNFLSLQLTPGGSSTAAAPSSSSTQTSAAQLPPGASVGPAGFPVMPFTFTFQGSFFHLADFFGRLQRFVVATQRRIAVSGRLMSLNGITLSPSSAGFPQIVATVSATTYLLPTSEGLTNGATSAAPATTPNVQNTSGTATPAAAPAAIAAPTP